MNKKVLFWVLAVILSLSIMVYQRMTGPTYEKDLELTYQGEIFRIELPRSHGGEEDCPIVIELPETIEGKIIYRKFPTDDPWDTLRLSRKNDTLIAFLPNQPPAGKLEYYLDLKAGDDLIEFSDSENVVIRFKGAVPAWAQVPHILFMVLTVIWSVALIFFAAANMPVYRKHLGFAIIFLLIGGFILGPLVQYFAFGDLWTGWPFGKDLTDNKTLAALIMFLVAFFFRKKSYGRWLAILASLVLLAVYLIPHSMNGSELDPETGEIITGNLLALMLLVKVKNKSDIISSKDSEYIGQ